MTQTDEGRGPQFLQETVVSLAGDRFEKFYHHSSGVHIVKQLAGTEFRTPGISGTGEFADEAYVAYVTALRSFVAVQPEARLREFAGRLAEFAPVGAPKVEVQVQLPGTLAHEINVHAKAMNVGIDAYLNLVLDDCLHLNFDDDLETSSWLERFAQQQQQLHHHVVEVARCTLYLSLPLSGFVGLERLTARMSSDHLSTVSGFISNVILQRERHRSGVSAIRDSYAQAAPPLAVASLGTEAAH